MATLRSYADPDVPPPAPKTQPGVLQACERLEKAISWQQDVIATLETRIEPVLRPQDQADECAEKAATREQSPLAEHLHTCARHIENNTARLEESKARLDLA